MPNNSNVPLEKQFAKVKLHQMPITKFQDWLDAIDVKLLDFTDPFRAKAVGYIAQHATWLRTMEDALKDAAEYAENNEHANEAAFGKSLPLNLEMIHFTFLVGGISRITTHQIVRTRIGVTYSQRCSGDQDIRHDDVLVPRDIAADPDCYKEFKNHTLEFKEWYARHADVGHSLGTHSIQTLRSMAPHNLSQFIIVSGSLLAFMGLIGKRACSCETIEYNTIAEKYRALICEKYPEFTDFLKADCFKKDGCYHMKNHSPLHGNIYLPDKQHDFEYNEKNFVYQFTREQMVENYPHVQPEFYYGKKQISEGEYNDWLDKYNKVNR